MITLIKLGGSLITDKNAPRHFRKTAMQDIVSQIKMIVGCMAPEDRFIIGHGSGSFGHIEAKQYDTIHGVTNFADWLGFTKVAHAASELNQLVMTELVTADLPVFRFQPSASIVADSGKIKDMDTHVLRWALATNLIPVIHGDVAFDTRLGGTIVSTETIFTYLVEQIEIKKIILLGEVNGVLDKENKVIPHITPDLIGKIKLLLGGSSGIDVTGGMYQKVMDMINLVQQKQGLHVVIANGNTPNILVDLVCHDKQIGTIIST